MRQAEDKYAYIEIGAPGNYEFDLLNESGQVIDEKETRQVYIFDTEHLADGVYFIRVTDKNSHTEIATKKIVIAH